MTGSRLDDVRRIVVAGCEDVVRLPWGKTMPSKIEMRVLAYFRKHDPTVTKKTNLKTDLGLNTYQIVNIGTELAIELGCNPTRPKLKKCKTVGELVKLLEDSHSGVHGVAFLRARGETTKIAWADLWTNLA